MKLSSLKINSSRAEHGAWVRDLPEMGDLRLKVRGFGNTDYTAFLAKERALVPRDQREGGRRDGAIKQQHADAILIRGMVEHILIDWDGLTDENDKPVPFSKERAMAFLADPDFRPLRNAVAFAASEVEEMESDRVEAVVGNSSSASGGKPNGRRRQSTSAG
ncbi:hypothetical protein JRF84_07930 [Methylobacterium organophilum]|uniref:hypothetical protein n=1 Tax=Methylobacterium TaxID=407 RepID=UPI0019D0B81E|nr:hypothetical protein [Methylobacterium organophilum]MBN6819517.1 hypothetical protein [Methylobacterium organophilum]